MHMQDELRKGWLAQCGEKIVWALLGNLTGNLKRAVSAPRGGGGERHSVAGAVVVDVGVGVGRIDDELRSTDAEDPDDEQW